MSDTLALVLAIAGGAGAVLCLYGMEARTLPALKKLDAGFRMPDMRFGGFRAEGLFGCFDAVGEAGVRLMRRYWRMDFGFIACFLALMLVIGRNNASIPAVKWAMAGAAALRALLDAAENGLLLRISGAYPARRMERAANLCGRVTAAKFAALGLWILGLFASLFIRGMGMGR